MFRRCRWPAVALLIVAAGLVPLSRPVSAQGQQEQLPDGVEVQARGPVHEAFATLTGDPAPTLAIPKQPPAPIDEVPPEEKPEGDVIWIGGYWAWDDDRKDFLWVSGLWRTVPPGKQWVAGYWREDNNEWRWIPGFWASAAKQGQEEQQVTYLPQPPEAPKVAPPPKPPSEDSFFVPGTWIWNGRGYAWRGGYWARMQPGYVWVPDHFRWTPSGYVYVPGYWDLAVSKRGILYAPVVIRPSVVRVGFTYTPCYAVRDTIIVDSLFVRPTTCHYYFGDYYEPRYRRLGYESCIVYSQRRYDSIIVYERYERRRDPTWVNVQINLYNDRVAGRAPVPPRVVNTRVNSPTVVNNINQTVINQTVVQNNNLTMVAPTKTVVQNKNLNVVKLDQSTRVQARAQAQAVQAVAAQRKTAEVPTRPGAPRQARTASLNVPKTQPVNPGMGAPRATLIPNAKIDRPAATMNKPLAPVNKTPTAPLTKSPAPSSTPAARPQTLKPNPTPNTSAAKINAPVQTGATRPITSPPAPKATTPPTPRPGPSVPPSGIPAVNKNDPRHLPGTPTSRPGQVPAPPAVAKPQTVQPALAPRPGTLQSPKPVVPQRPAPTPGPRAPTTPLVPPRPAVAQPARPGQPLRAAPKQPLKPGPKSKDKDKDKR